MLDHLAISVSDYQKSKSFYLNVLAPLGYHLTMEFNDNVACFGVGKKPSFIMHQAGKITPKLHIAFHAKTPSAVDQFYAKALAAGGKDNGAPGIRERYHANYYGAFILDPDGYNVEAVCHASQDKIESPNSSEVIIVNHRKLKDGKTYNDFRQAWLPPVANPKDQSSLATYFSAPAKAYNAVNVDDPTEVITILLVQGGIEDIQREHNRIAPSETIRSERMKQVADKLVATKIYKIRDIDELGK